MTFYLFFYSQLSFCEPSFFNDLALSMCTSFKCNFRNPHCKVRLDISFLTLPPAATSSAVAACMSLTCISLATGPYTLLRSNPLSGSLYSKCRPGNLRKKKSNQIKSNRHNQHCSVECRDELNAPMFFHTSFFNLSFFITITIKASRNLSYVPLRLNNGQVIPSPRL